MAFPLPLAHLAPHGPHGPPRVYVPHLPLVQGSQGAPLQSAVDLLPATEFGPLRILRKGALNHDAIQRDVDAVRRLAAGIRAEDFLITPGNALLNACAMFVVQNAHGRVRTLRWSSRAATYRVVEVVL